MRIKIVLAAIALALLGMIPAWADNLSPGNTGVKSEVFYAYVATGETLSVTGEMVNATPGVASRYTLTVYKPDRTSKTTILSTVSSDRISYPSSFSKLASNIGGVWRIEFEQLAGPTTGQNIAMQRPTITVHSGNATKPGRVWATSWSLAQYALGNADWVSPTDVSIYTLTKSGIIHHITQYGYQGIESAITVNNYGNPGSNCQPLYASVEMSATPGKDDCPNYERYRIFFAAPDRNMPTTAQPYWDGKTASTLVPFYAWKNPTVNIAYQGDPSASPHYGGVVTARADTKGELTMWLDVNGNGIRDGADRVLWGSSQVAANVDQWVTWDGKDSNGTTLPRDTKITLRAELQAVGEVHWLLSDVEVRKGVRIEQTYPTQVGGHTLSNAQRFSVSWNDSKLSKTGRIGDIPALTGSAVNTASSTNTHGWSANFADSYSPNSWGNERRIDDWQKISALAAADFVPVNPDIRLVVSKTDGRSRVQVGDELTYTITVTNQEPQWPETAAALRDHIPPNTTFLTASDNGIYDPDTRTVSWPECTVAGGASVNRTVQIKVNEAATGQVINYATVSGKDSGQKAPPDPQSECPTDVCTKDIDDVVSPMLSVKKTDNREVAAPGDTLEYLVRVTNSGEGEARGIEITEHLPEHVTLQQIAATTPQPGDDAGEIKAPTDGWQVLAADSWELHKASNTAVIPKINLESKESIYFKLSTTVNPDAPRPADLHNLVTVKLPDDPEIPCPSNDPRCAEDHTRIDAANIQILKDLTTAGSRKGDIVTWQVTVRNWGTAQARDVIVTDYTPPQIKADTIEFSKPSQGTASGNTWQIGELSPARIVKANVSGKLQQDLTSGEELTNVVRVRTPDDPTKGIEPNDVVLSSVGEPVSGVSTNQSQDCEANESIEKDTDGCDFVSFALESKLAISKDDGKEKVLPGEEINYTLRASNVGSAAESAAVITDTLPAELDFVSATGDGSYESSTRTITWPAIRIASGKSVTRTVTARVREDISATEKIINFAVVKGAADESINPLDKCPAPRCDSDVDTFTPGKSVATGGYVVNWGGQIGAPLTVLAFLLFGVAAGWHIYQRRRT